MEFCAIRPMFFNTFWSSSNLKKNRLKNERLELIKRGKLQRQTCWCWFPIGSFRKWVSQIMRAYILYPTWMVINHDLFTISSYTLPSMYGRIPDDSTMRHSTVVSRFAMTCWSYVALYKTIWNEICWIFI